MKRTSRGREEDEQAYFVDAGVKRQEVGDWDVARQPDAVTRMLTESIE